MVTITSCAPTVTLCLKGYVVAESSFVRTECYPASLSVTTSSRLVSSTVTSCAPGQAGCSVGAVSTSTTVDTSRVWVDPQQSTTVPGAGQIIVTRLLNGVTVVETARVLPTEGPVSPENTEEEEEEYDDDDDDDSSTRPPTARPSSLPATAPTSRESGIFGINTATFATSPRPTLATPTGTGYNGNYNSSSSSIARPTIPVVTAAASSLQGLTSTVTMIVTGLSLTFGVMLFM